MASIVDAMPADTKFVAILDGCDQFYPMMPRNAEVHMIPREGNRKTFVRQLDLLLNATTEYVAFVEDDYLFKPGAFASMIYEGLWVADFATPLNHPDYYTRPALHGGSGRMLRDGWQSRYSTALTFCCRRSTLLETAGAFRTYGHGNLDVSIWLGLTREFRPHKFILPTLVYTPRQLFYGKRYTLAVPVPGLAQHL